MSNKVKTFLIILSVIFISVGLGLLIIGYGGIQYDYKGLECEVCYGYGCRFCNGTGTILGNDDTYPPSFVGGIALLVIGIVLVVIAFKTPYASPNYAPVNSGEVSEYAVKVQLFDTGYSGNGRAVFTMKYTFTDADSGVVLGQGKQFDIVTLNVDKPTRIRCHLGRGFKDAFINYIPRKNAKYNIYPDIYKGLIIEETDSF